MPGMDRPLPGAPVPAPSARVDAGGPQVQVHLTLPALKLVLAVTKFSRTKIRTEVFLNVTPKHHRNWGREN